MSTQKCCNYLKVQSSLFVATTKGLLISHTLYVYRTLFFKVLTFNNHFAMSSSQHIGFIMREPVKWAVNFTRFCHTLPKS